MKKILTCRRTITSLFAIICLTGLGYTKNIDVAASIAAIAIGLSGSNAFQASRQQPQPSEKE